MIYVYILSLKHTALLLLDHFQVRPIPHIAIPSCSCRLCRQIQTCLISQHKRSSQADDGGSDAGPLMGSAGCHKRRLGGASRVVTGAKTTSANGLDTAPGCGAGTGGRSCCGWLGGGWCSEARGESNVVLTGACCGIKFLYV